MNINYRTIQVGDVEVAYREAGPTDAPVILLLHGFPTSSHMFRDLIPLLSDRYRLVAPDLPGFGQTKAPPRGTFDYTFDNLAKTIDGFTEALGLTSYALYVFDYGAPTGYRIAVAHPERVTAIISQNGNAYMDGFSDQWGPWQSYWREPTPENREACRASLTPKPSATGNISQEPRRSGCRPMATRSTSLTWRATVPMRSSSISFWTIAPTLRDILSFRPTSESISRHCLPSGAGMTRPSFRPAPRPTSVIFRMRRCTCWTPATSRLRRMHRRSPR